MATVVHRLALQHRTVRRLTRAFVPAGLSYKNLDATGLKNVFSMLQNHYVERFVLQVKLAHPALPVLN